MASKKEYLRKNPTIKLLREMLHQFRIDDMKVEMSGEMVDTMKSGKFYDLSNQEGTGREVVTIRLIGNRKNACSLFSQIKPAPYTDSGVYIGNDGALFQTTPSATGGDVKQSETFSSNT